MVDLPSKSTHFEEEVHNQAWRKAMEKEILSIYKNDTWKLTKLPPGKILISTKWIYKTKQHADRSIYKYKTRLVARRFEQMEGIDYKEIFASVCKWRTSQLLIALVAQNGYKLLYMDVKTAFLHG